MAGFQTSVQLNPAYGIPGTFGQIGPWNTVPAMVGELTASSAGVTIGGFAWADDATGVVYSAKPNMTSTRFGFVAREGQRAIISTYLGESSFAVAPGFEITLYSGGSYLYTVPTGGAIVGQRIFAKYADGSIVLGTAGTPPTTTGSVTTTNLSATVTYTPASLTLVPGMPITGAGIPSNSYVGTVNSGAGTFTLANAAGASVNATASATVTATVNTAYETRFYAQTTNVAGEVGIMADRGF